MRRLATLAAVAAMALTLALPAAAPAHDEFSFIGGGSFGDSTGIDLIFSTFRVTGEVTVDFHGDEAAGCAEMHLCGVAGRVRWDPSGRGALFAYSYRENGKRFLTAVALIGNDDRESPPIRTSARVRRAGTAGTAAGLCTDLGSQQFTAVSIEPRRGSSLELRVIGLSGTALAPGDIMRTRCAGPMSADVSHLIPAHLVSRRALVRGGRLLDYSADRPFSSHGLSGRVRSTVKIRLDAGQHFSDTDSDPPGPTHVVRTRAIDATYAIESVSGQISTQVNGIDDPDLCGPLDACGLMGTVSVAPQISSGEVRLFGSASIRYSRRDLRRALGLVGGGLRRRGVERFGIGYWDESGSIRSELTRDGVPACSDSAPLPREGGLELGYSGGRLRASYGSAVFGDDLQRTRCPGPGLADVTGGRSLASTAIPIAALRRRRVTLHFDGGDSYGPTAYGGQIQPDLTIVLRRTRVREYVQVSRDPGAPAPPPGVRPIR